VDQSGCNSPNTGGLPALHMTKQTEHTHGTDGTD